MQGRSIDTSVNDDLWRRISVSLTRTHGSRGRPRGSDRECYEAAVWALVNGRALADRSDAFPGCTTCRQRLLLWSRRGALREAFTLHVSALTKNDLASWLQSIERQPLGPASGRAREQQAWPRSVFSDWRKVAREIIELASAALAERTVSSAGPIPRSNGGECTLGKHNPGWTCPGPPDEAGGRSFLYGAIARRVASTIGTNGSLANVARVQREKGVD